MTFINPRFNKPVRLATADTYVFSPPGRAYSPDSFRSRWNRWLGGTEEGKRFLEKWAAFCGHLAKRAGKDFHPEETNQPALHGLSGSAEEAERRRNGVG